MCSTAGSLLNLSHSYGNPLPAVCWGVCVCRHVRIHLCRMSKGWTVCVYCGDGSCDVETGGLS